MTQTFNELFAEYVRLSNAGSLKQANLKLVEIIRLMWDRIGDDDDVADGDLTDEEYDLILNGEVIFAPHIDIADLEEKATAQDAQALGRDLRDAAEPVTTALVTGNEVASVEDSAAEAELTEDLKSLSEEWDTLAATVNEPVTTDKAVLDAEAAAQAADGSGGEPDAEETVTENTKRRVPTKKKA